MTSMKDHIKVEVTGDADSSELYVENTIENPALYTIEDNHVSLVSENVEKVIKAETDAFDGCIFESKFEIVKDVAYQSNMELLLDSQDVADNSIHVNHGNTSDKIFLCDICGKSFVSNHLLKNHLTEHKKQINNNTNKCKFCKKQFKLRFGLNIHIQKHHNSMHKYSKYIENKKNDEKIDQPRFDTIPNINGTQFLSRDVTGRYSSDHTRLVKINSTIESTAPHTYIPSNNIISNPEQTEILLNTSERNSSDQIGLVSRNSIIVSTASQNSIQFNPTETESIASDSETMSRKQNKKNKSITKTNFCNLCNRKFTKRCYFTNHMIMKHNVNTNIPKQLTSIDYNKSIIPSANTELTNEYENKLSVPVNYKNNNLNNHVSKSNKKKSIICLICNTLFAHLGALKSHMRIHGCKTYKCQYCYMQFDKKGICTMHEKTHCKSNLPEFTSNKATNISTKSGRFECNICMKTYSTPFNLKKHKKNVHKVLDSTHLNSYDNTCLQKDKLIDENQQKLVIKKRNKCHHNNNTKCKLCDNSIHVNHGNTSDKIFLCDICGKSFVSNHLLKNHLTEHKKQINNNTNKCKFCKKQFKLKFGLNRHIQKHHDSMHKYSKYIENKKYDEKIDQPRFDPIPNINGTQFLSRDVTGRYSSDHTRLVKSNSTVESTAPHTYIPINNIISNPEQTEILLNTSERNSSDQIGLVSRNSIIVSTASQNSIQFNPTETESIASDSETMSRKQNKKNKSITKTNFCNLCNRKFTKRCYFTNHMIMKHNVNTNIPKPLTSIDYNKSIIPSANTELTNEYENKLSVPVNYKNNNLNNHVSKSNKKKSIICLICNTLFAHLGALKSHMRIHGCKTYKCQFCYMQFDKKGICTMHEKTHCKSNLPELTSNKATNISTKSGRFECNICMKTYSTSYNLKKHKKKCS